MNKNLLLLSYKTVSNKSDDMTISRNSKIQRATKPSKKKQKEKKKKKKRKETSKNKIHK